MTDRRRNASSAMTLIEVLVVLGIVGVLAGLLFVAIATAMRQARATRCQANLEGIGKLIAQWAAEHNGQVVPYRLPVDAAEDDNNVCEWFVELAGLASNDARYLDGNTWKRRRIELPDDDLSGSYEPTVPGSAEIFKCPEAARYAFSKRRISYGLNCDTKDEDGEPYTFATADGSSLTVDDKKFDTYDMSEIVNPAAFILVADTGYVSDDNSTHRDDRSWISSSRQGQYSGDRRVISGVHQGNANVLFGDLHVAVRSASDELGGNINKADDPATYKFWSLRSK